ncbi:hypothetical protein U1769_24325 [Sphingomonas sp. ZT3P38]|uniref:hypothetical protein n=1 Tax=Parasphingomonas zepuensis TaxID=3096161 RepID=UPI002FC67B9B
MSLFSSHPIRTIRIEPRPEVAAFYDRALSRTERYALVTAGMIATWCVVRGMGWL